MLLALAACLALLQVAQGQESLESLLRRLPSVAAAGDNGIGGEKETLARSLREYEALAIPPLLDLLKNGNARTRELTGYVLRDIRGLKEEHLDALIEARRAGNGWIPPAIAHIGTPRAIAFLVEDLESRPQTDTQVTWALRCVGEPAALALARRFAADKPISEALATCAERVLEDLGEHAVPALDILLQAAANKELPDANRSLAAEAIGSIGLPARRTIPALRALERAEPVLFAEAVERAILGIGGPEAAEILADQLGREPGVCTLRDIAALRENGFSAGVEVLAVLANSNPDLRVSAARTLGYIGYSPAVDALVRETSNAQDWRLAGAAVESLGRLRSARAIPELAWTAANYWYPPVRHAARQALAVIRGTSEYVSRFHSQNFAFEFFDTMDEERRAVRVVALRDLQPEPDRLHADELASLSYTIEQRTVKPGCGLKVPGGKLLGANRGEWGGEIVFQRPDGSQQTVLGENIESLHRTPNGIIAVTGLAHLSLESGDLYRIDLRPDGSYEANWWKRLPGEPSAAGMLADGSLVVSCRGGTVVVTPSGEIRMAE